MSSVISPPASPVVPSTPRLQPRGRGLLIGVNFRTTLKALQANQLRSFLTTLGVIIGVGTQAIYQSNLSMRNLRL